MSGFYKGVSGLSLFVSIRLLLDYLGADNYGLWVLVFTLFQLVLLMDIGVQSSLKTQIPVLVHEGKKELIKSYIKTTYKISIYIAVSLFIIFVLFTFFVDLKEFFNIGFQSSVFINFLFLFNVFFFCISFVANIHKSLYVAFLKGKYSEQSVAVNQIGILILIVLLISFFPNISSERKLIYISIINGVFTFLVNIGYTIGFFKLEKLTLSDSVKTNFLFVKRFLKLGFKYMVVQVSVLVIFISDTYIISHVFKPSEIIPYEIVNKLFQFPFMILFAALSPLWSMFAKNYIEKNKKELLQSFKKFNRSFILICLLVALFIYISPFVISVWIKNPVQIPSYLILLTGIVTLLRVYTTFYSFFLNGIGNLNAYILLLIISVVIKIPLSYYFIDLGYGINSVVISSLIIMLVWMLVIPFKCYQLVKIIKK
ncbi:MATE family efflux transporter [uncultured Flavobacterium sp.]|uniref:lipopolysaccharide biosynthesis protein n=1 Tax=uncultured Flavobacterium sp. TaxID=165435 RepID=UPI0030CA4098